MTLKKIPPTDPRYHRPLAQCQPDALWSILTFAGGFPKSFGVFYMTAWRRLRQDFCCSMNPFATTVLPVAFRDFLETVLIVSCR
jgi:hypothetical protein